MGCGCSKREEVEVLEEVQEMGVQEVVSRTTHISAGQANLTITLALVPEKGGLREASSRAIHSLPSPTTSASSNSPIPNTSPDHKPRALDPRGPSHPNKTELVDNNINLARVVKPRNITSSSKEDYRKEVASMAEDLGLVGTSP